MEPESYIAGWVKPRECSLPEQEMLQEGIGGKLELLGIFMQFRCRQGEECTTDRLLVIIIVQHMSRVSSPLDKKHSILLEVMSCSVIIKKSCKKREHLTLRRGCPSQSPPYLYATVAKFHPNSTQVGSSRSNIQIPVRMAYTHVSMITVWVALSCPFLVMFAAKCTFYIGSNLSTCVCIEVVIKIYVYDCVCAYVQQQILF